MKAAGKRWIWYAGRAARFRVWYLADLHLMNKGCAEHDLRRDIETIRADPFSFWLGGGDYCDFIGYRDKRFDPDSVSEWVSLKSLGDLGRVGMTRVRNLFLPIRAKCLGLLLGNHELRYQVATEHESLHGWLCEELGVPNLEYCCLFDLLFCRYAEARQPVLQAKPPPHCKYDSQTFRVFCHHGSGYAQTPGGKLNRLVQFLQSFDADLYFVGHVHDHMARREAQLAADRDCTHITEHRRLGIIAGSYLKTYSEGTTSYGEQRGYRPTALGPAVAEIYPETRELKAAI